MRGLYSKCLIVLYMVLVCAANGWAESAKKSQNDDTGISLPQVVAKVNGADIPSMNVLQQLKIFIRQFEARGKSFSLDQQKLVAKKLVETEINAELLLQKGKALGLQITTQMVEKKVRELRSFFPSEKQFQDRLALRNMTLDQYKEELKDTLMVEAVIKQEVEPHVRIKPSELKEYYENNLPTFFKNETAVKARVILIKVDPEGGPEADKKAQEKIRSILGEAKFGSDFASLARKYSQDVLVEVGGDLGFFTRKTMLPAFSDRAFEMKVGDISDVFQTEYGYHILKVTDKLPAGYRPFEKVEKGIRAIVKNKKVEEKTKIYIDALRQKADVKIYF